MAVSACPEKYATRNSASAKNLIDTVATRRYFP